MSFELLVAWRYLFKGKPTGPVWALLALSLVVCGLGAALLYGSVAEATGAALLIFGALGVVAASSLALFSTIIAVAVIGLAIGVGTVVTALSITGGYEAELQRKVLGVNAHVMVLKYGVDFAEYRQVITQAEAMVGVRGAAPFIVSEMLLARGSELATVMVKGVDPARVAAVLDLAQQIEAPRGVDAARLPALLAAGSSSSALGGMIVGCELARRLKLEVGDGVRMISPLSNLAGRSSAALPPGSRSFDFRVSGVFCSGFAEYDKRLVYLRLGEVQRFFEHGDVAMGVEISLEEPLRAPTVARDLLARLGGPPYRTLAWRELNHALFLVVATQKVILTGVIGIIVLVAAFNVLAGLAVLVLRKRREIAILKSLGASGAGIAWVFQSAGVVVWAVGASLGLALGRLAVALLARYGFPLEARIYQISELPVRVDPWEFLLTALFALLLCVLATLYPASRAARVDPVQGLRHS